MTAASHFPFAASESQSSGAIETSRTAMLQKRPPMTIARCGSSIKPVDAS
jgi:hypothetical protein